MPWANRPPPTSAPYTATASAPPNGRKVFSTPEARPARCGWTAVSISPVIAGTASEPPRDTGISSTATSHTGAAAGSRHRALFAPIFDSPARPTNAARFTFLDPAAPAFYPDWDAVADQNVATLRAEVGRNPYDKALSDLIGELSTRGDTFRQRCAQHDVRRHRAGAKRVNHPVVGELTFEYETMDLAADEGLSLIVCNVAPGSRDADALKLLASWNADSRGEQAVSVEQP